MENYYLDVAFSSDVTPQWQNQPIAMAYGFVTQDEGGVWGEGIQTVETMQVNDQVWISVYDFAPAACTVNKIMIVFNYGSPFAWDTREIPGDESLPNSIFPQGSPGVNWFDGTAWMFGPYLAESAGEFEFTVSAYVTDSNGNEKEFKVDPEIIVEGGG